MSLVTDPALLALYVKLHSEFQNIQSGTPVFWDKVATKVESTSQGNGYGWLSETPEMREWLGARQIKRVAERFHYVPNKDYEATVGIKKSRLADSDFASEIIQMKGMALAAKKLPDRLIASLLLNGQSNLCFDGQYFFDTDHPTDPEDAASSTYSNYYSSGKALSAANFDAVYSAMAAVKDANGKEMGITPNLLVVPPQLRGTAASILTVEQGASGATNVYKGWCDILVLPELASAATTWYLLDTSRLVMPFVVQERAMPEFTSSLDFSQDYVFFNNEVLFGVEARYGAGYTLPFLAAKALA